MKPTESRDAIIEVMDRHPVLFGGLSFMALAVSMTGFLSEGGAWWAVLIAMNLIGLASSLRVICRGE